MSRARRQGKDAATCALIRGELARHNEESENRGHGVSLIEDLPEEDTVAVVEARHHLSRPICTHKGY